MDARQLLPVSRAAARLRAPRAPVTWFFSFVRTNAAPLPGLTCRCSDVNTHAGPRGISCKHSAPAAREVTQARRGCGVGRTEDAVRGTVNLDEDARAEVVAGDRRREHLHAGSRRSLSPQPPRGLARNARSGAPAGSRAAALEPRGRETQAAPACRAWPAVAQSARAKKRAACATAGRAGRRAALAVPVTS